MKERDSNMELLRIIAMWMITIHHFLVNAGMTYSGIAGRAPLAPGYEWATMLNGFVYIGVNCFILISGYYGIKFKWKGLFKLWLFCAFYELCSPIISHLLHGDPISIMQTLHDTIFCFSFSHNWFIMCYVCLYFLSPLLNSARDNMDKRKYLIVLGLLTILTLYFGYWRHVVFWNPDGYSVANFVYVYLIGGYIQKYVRTDKMLRGVGIIRYICCLCVSVGRIDSCEI